MSNEPERARKTWLWWSSGKDSAWALHVLQQRRDLQVDALVTTLNREHQRVTMHGVRRELVRYQARAAGLALHEMTIPDRSSNEAYQASFGGVLRRASAAGVEVMAFGDIALEDVRAYREEQFRDSTIQPIFPLWGLSTAELAHDMVASGLRGIVVCVDPKQLDRRFAGQLFDRGFLQELPQGVDPCGENGEFHTLVYAGPMFNAPLAVHRDGTVERSGFLFTDVIKA
jgi:uncharacterized protein (TIGR00290 family)